MPKGLLTEEQTKLVVEVANSDSNSVIKNTLFRLESVFASRPSLPENPTASDIKNLAGNLSSVVPAGFLLLHNDLKKIIDPNSENQTKDSSDSGSKVSIMSFLKPLLMTAGAAAISVGIVKSLFTGVSPGTSTHLQTEITELNKKLTATELSKDQEVLDAQKEAFISYLKSYFLQQSIAMTVSGTLESVGVGAAKAVVGFFKEIFGKKEETLPNKLQEVVDEVIKGITPTKFVDENKDAIKTEVKIGLLAYIGTYFLTQTAAMSTDNILSGTAGAVGNSINKFFTNLFTIGNAPKSYDRIQNLIDELIEEVSFKDLEGEKEITQALISGITSYVQCYFETQTAAMQMDTFSNSIGGLAVNAVKGFFTTLFGKKDPNVEKLQSIINEVLDEDNLKVEEVAQWEEVDNARKEGIASYIKNYFTAMGVAVASSDVSKTLAGSFAESAKNFVGSINPFNKEKKSKSADKQPESSSFFQKVTELALSLNDEDLPGKEELSSLKKESMLQIAKNILDIEVKNASSKLEKNKNSYNVSFQMDSNTTLSSKITEINSDKVLETLNKISETLGVLSTLVTSLSSRDNSPIPIITPFLQSTSDDLSVDIPG